MLNVRYYIENNYISWINFLISKDFKWASGAELSEYTWNYSFGHKYKYMILDIHKKDVTVADGFFTKNYVSIVENKEYMNEYNKYLRERKLNRIVK